MISGLLNRQHIANSVICDKINFRRQLIMKRVLLKLSGEALAGEKKT